MGKRVELPEVDPVELMHGLELYYTSETACELVEEIAHRSNAYPVGVAQLREALVLMDAGFYDNATDKLKDALRTMEGDQ